MFVSEVEFMLHKKQLNRIIKIQELKLKLLEKEIKINKIDTRIQELLEIQKTLDEIEKQGDM